MSLLAQQQPLVQLTPDQVLGFVLLDIAIILVVARAMGAVFKRLGQPTVVGEIVGGILLGPTLLGPTIFAWNAPWSFLNCDAALAVSGADPSITTCLFPPQSRSMLSVLGQIALVLFMFLVGLELDWDLLKGKGKKISIVAFGAVAVPIGLAFAIGGPLFNGDFVAGFGTVDEPSQLSFTLFLAAMLSVTAFPVMARILQEKGMTASAMGSVGVAAAAIVTVAMFLTVAVAAGVATEQGPSSLAVKFVAAAVYIAVLFLVVRPLLAPLGAAYEREGRLTPGLFAVVLIILFTSSYAAHQIGINVIVGGFLAGAVLPARQTLFRDMAGRLSDFTAVILLPIFLAFSGLNTDFTQLRLGHVPGIALFVAAGVIGKWLGSAVFARFAGMSWNEGNILGILMNCRGLLVLVVALIGFNQGVISAPMQVGGVVMALVTTMMTGPLFDAFSSKVQVPSDETAAPMAAGSVRILAGLDDLDDAPAIASLAFALTGGQRPSEVVLARLLQLSPYDEIGSGIGAEVAEIERSMRAMKVLSGFAPAGITVTPLTHSTTDVRRELARLTRDRSADVLLVADRDAPTVAEHLRVGEDRGAATIVGIRVGGLEAREGGAVLVVGDTPAVSQLAANLAAGRGSTIEHRRPQEIADPQSLREAGIVVIDSVDHAGVADALKLAAVPVCVVYDGVLEAPVPADAAPPR